jgi:hypothetical protein
MKDVGLWIISFFVAFLVAGWCVTQMPANSRPPNRTLFVTGIGIGTGVVYVLLTKVDWYALYAAHRALADTIFMVGVFVTLWFAASDKEKADKKEGRAPDDKSPPL